MVTSCSFGFISYNSHDFLKHVLETFIDEGLFNRSACWFHESVEEGKKDHFHCWVEPVKQIDTGKIGDRFVEISENGDKNSIAVLPKCKSDWNNAYLYGIHDSDYLAYKNLEKELVNIKSENHIYLGDFREDIAQAEYYRFHKCLAPYMRIKELIEQGCSLEEVYIKLRIPYAQLYTVRQAYKTIHERLLMTADKDLVEINDKSPFNDKKRG